jgi:hypothetical protein
MGSRGRKFNLLLDCLRKSSTGVRAGEIFGREWPGAGATFFAANLDRGSFGPFQNEIKKRNFFAIRNFYWAGFSMS